MPNTYITNIMPSWKKSILGVQFGGRIHADLGGTFGKVKSATLNGLTTTPYQLVAKNDIVRFFAIEFTPVGMYLLFKENNEHFVDESIDVFDVIPSEKSYQLSEAMSEVYDMAHKVKIIECFLHQLLPDPKTWYRIKPILYSLKIIEESDGKTDIRHISRTLQLSDSYIRRLFKQVTGVSPKQYARVTRFQDNFNRVMNGNHDVFTAITDSEYYDQSHFIKEFKQFTGFSPNKLPKEQFQFARFFT